MSTLINSPLVKNILPGLAVRGNIKIGMKGEFRPARDGSSEYQLPKKLDHFIITSLERDSKTNNFLRDGEVYKQLKLGEKPTRLPVTFVYDDISLNLQSRLACYAGKKLWCSGDGEKASRKSERSTDKTWGEASEVPCPCHRFSPDYDGAEKCKLNARLAVCFRGFDVFGGIYKFSTTSYNSYQSLLGTMIQARHATGGRLAGLPFDLVIGPKTAVVPKTGAVTTVYIVWLEFKGDVKLLREETKRLLLEDKEYFGRLSELEKEAKQYVSAAVPETEDAEFVEEFYPEQAIAEEKGNGHDVTVTGEEPPAAQTPALAEPPKRTRKRVVAPAEAPAPQDAQAEPEETTPAQTPATGAATKQAPELVAKLTGVPATNKANDDEWF